jgi:hypothetical protein
VEENNVMKKLKTYSNTASKNKRVKSTQLVNMVPASKYYARKSV